MIEELKTLKDIVNLEVQTEEYADWRESYDDDEYNKRPEDERREIIDIDNLKKEAINWIKELDDDKGKTFVRFSRNECDAVILWVRYFFNITDEDLKQ